MATLPPTICLKSVYNHKYLRYISESGEVHGLLHYGADDSTDQYTQFIVEYSKTYPDLVHIKCRFNNKYWVRWSPSHWWISGSADNIDENKSSWTCTLFKPIIEGDDVRLIHVQLGHYACLWRAGAPYYACLFGGSSERDRDRCEVFNVVNWDVAPSKLPPTICLKSVYNHKFLRYVSESGEIHGLLHYGADDSTDRYTQFIVEYSKTYPDLVHIKCRFNNKYWVRWSPSHWWISGSADNIDENKNNWSCTLFKPIIEGDDVRLIHVQLGHYACLWRAGAPYYACLFGGSSERDRDRCEVFNVVNWDISPSKLPKNATFKGDNGKYLGALISESGVPYLQFSYDEPTDPKAAHQVFEASDGLVSIKSMHFGKFWRFENGESGWIMADINEDPLNTNKNDGLFKPKVLNNKFVLSNKSETWFCKRFSKPPRFESCLNAATQSVDDFTPLEVINLDLSPLSKLPKNATFKGDNGKYLGALISESGVPYLQFSYDDPKDPKAAHQVLEGPDGLVCIKSVHFGKFWRLENGESGWIMANIDEDPRNTNNNAGMFKLKKSGDKFVLSNKSETWICKRFSKPPRFESCLNAATQSVDEFSPLELINLDTV